MPNSEEIKLPLWNWLGCKRHFYTSEVGTYAAYGSRGKGMWHVYYTFSTLTDEVGYSNAMINDRLLYRFEPTSPRFGNEHADHRAPGTETKAL